MSAAWPGGAPRCCWPDCRGWAPQDLSVPMCWPHARTVAEDFTRSMDDYLQKEETRQAERKVERLANPVRKGDVYYLRVDGLIKIGFSSDVWMRMRSYPPTAKLLAVERGTEETERERHGQFRLELEHGREWFRESPELTAWIAKVRDEHGDPSEKAYRFTRPNGRGGVTQKRSRNRR